MASQTNHQKESTMKRNDQCANERLVLIRTEAFGLAIALLKGFVEPRAAYFELRGHTSDDNLQVVMQPDPDGIDDLTGEEEAEAYKDYVEAVRQALALLVPMTLREDGTLWAEHDVLVDETNVEAAVA
jgi:hypothetical protein